MSSKIGSVTLEEIIISMPPQQREVIATLRDRAYEAERRAQELESELSFSRQRLVELENELAAASSHPPSVPAPQTNLEELIAQLKAQHQGQVEAVRRHTTEKIHNLDDTSYDAEAALQTSVTRSMRPLPKNFEFVDLLQMREQFTAEGFAPASPLQRPLINEFVIHIDGVRQCTKDNRFAQLYFDPIKADLLRRMFDVCKNVEAKMGSTAYLQLPSQSIVVDNVPKESSEPDMINWRRKEFTAHMSSIDKCGDVFTRASKDVTQLDDFAVTSSSLPHFMGEFELITQAMSNDAENLQRNELVLVEAGSLHIENFTAHRKQLVDQAQNLTQQIEKGERSVDAIFAQIMDLLRKAEDGYRDVMETVGHHAKTQVDIATCDTRIAELRKAVEVEVQKQQRFLEGTKFTTFLCNKSKDLYRRLHTNLEESIRSRRDLCERVKLTSQEQLYTMAELLHDMVVKRQQSDLQLLRVDQTSLENANRSLMGLVHQPAEMDRQMSIIRDLTLSISHLKNRVSQSNHDIGAIRGILSKYQTIQFLRRDTNFLSIYDNVEKTSRVREKLEDAIQRLKYVSEVLVEVSDPDTRQDYVVQQCLEALKVSVADMTDLIAAKDQMDLFDDAYRIGTSTKIKRHKRLVAHFLEEIKDGTNNLTEQAPAIELNVVSLLEGVENVLGSLTNNDEPSMLQTINRPRKGVIGGLSAAGAGGAAGAHVDPVTGQVVPGADGAGGGTGSHARDGMDYAIEEEQHARHTLARYSVKLKASHDLLKLTKPAGTTIEMSNTSALGAIGFRLGSGVHSYTVRIGPNSSRLLVGFADWNLPLDGYCNSLKYNGCYYLHLGNGTLWAPDQGIERKAYTYEAVGTAVGTLLKAVIDTNNRTIGFVWDDVNLGIAFRNVTLTRTLYPAFEVFSNGCSIEFVNPVNAPENERNDRPNGRAH
jgi:hypothetical protein